jgi:hypothetical protein
MAAKKKRKSGPSGPSGPSGQHIRKRYVISEDRDNQFADWDAEAAKRDLSRADYVRQMADSGLTKK